jgi:NAD(P)-dependent dehydrogenase (short-subunit alcohol dehydrogenase family)
MVAKVGIITGGASGTFSQRSFLTTGIGLALANDLAQKGWKLAIVDMDSEGGEAAVAKFGKGNAIFIKADVSKWDENVRFFKETKEAFGRIDFGKHLCIVIADVASGSECRN